MEKPPYDMALEPRYPDLAGQVAIVTGTSRGIGQGIAGYLARQGVRLAITSRNEENGLAFRDKLRASGAECHWVTTDLMHDADAERLMNEALAIYGQVDLLVNNAARLSSAPLLKTTPEIYHNSLEGNLHIVYGITRRVAEHMAARRSGVIVNISSVGGLRAHHGSFAYDASKGALDNMTRSMALELSVHGIRVNGVAPGGTWGGFHENPNNPRRDLQNIDAIPLARLGRAEEIGAAVAFLASRQAAYITGQTLYVDGGLTTQLVPRGIMV